MGSRDSASGRSLVAGNAMVAEATAPVNVC